MLALAFTCQTAVFNVSLLDFDNEVEELMLLLKRPRRARDAKLG
jgi:hypothetical protein